MTRNGAKIMVVEDEVLVGIMLARKLREKGYDVGEVITTGEEAVLQAERDMPSAILMDVTLAGEINGIEAARKIKESYNIPIIIFSGYDQQSLRQETEKIRPVAIVSKMGSIADITEAIEKALASS